MQLLIQFHVQLSLVNVHYICGILSLHYSHMMPGLFCSHIFIEDFGNVLLVTKYPNIILHDFKAHISGPIKVLVLKLLYLNDSPINISITKERFRNLLLS